MHIMICSSFVKESHRYGFPQRPIFIILRTRVTSRAPRRMRKLDEGPPPPSSLFSHQQVAELQQQPKVGQDNNNGWKRRRRRNRGPDCSRVKRVLRLPPPPPQSWSEGGEGDLVNAARRKKENFMFGRGGDGLNDGGGKARKLPDTLLDEDEYKE